MTRENLSCKSRKLLAGCCRRQVPLFTLAFLSFIVTLPITTLVNIQSLLRDGWNNSDPESRADMVQSLQVQLYKGDISNVALVGLAVIAAISVFSYLHVRNQTDFYHALPVTRGQLFALNVTTGLLAVIPAYLINVVFSCIVCTTYGYGDVIDGKLMAYSLLIHLAGFLLIYAISILAAILCGNRLVSLMACVWLQGGLLAGWIFVRELLDVLYPARSITATHAFWLSPPIHLWEMTVAIHDIIYRQDASTEYVKTCILSSLGSLVAAAAILVLCFILYRIRKSENTGLAIVFPAIQQPIKFYMVTVIGIACGLVFESTTSNWYIMFLGMALGVILASGMIEIIYDLDFGSIFHHWRSMGVYAAVAVVILGCMAMDITHWNSTIPDRDDIIAADLSSSLPQWSNDSTFDANSYNYTTVYDRIIDIEDTAEEDEQDEKLLESKEAIDAIYNSASIGAQAMTGDRSTIRDDIQYTVTFTLKNGKTLQRTYYMPYDTDALYENGAAVRFTQEYLNTRTAAVQAQQKKDEFTLMLVGNYVNTTQLSPSRIYSTRAITSILDTLKRESLLLTKDYVSQHAPVLILRVATDTAQQVLRNSLMDFNCRTTDVYDIPVYERETETLAMLAEQVDTLSTGFGTEPIQRVTVTTYDETHENSVKKTYTDAEEIDAWRAKLVPHTFVGAMDPVYETSGIPIEITMEDGMVISCLQRAEDEDTET